MTEFLQGAPDEMAPEAQIQKMHYWLATDLEDWLERNAGASLCIAIDGFERIQTTAARRSDIQQHLTKLCAATLVNYQKPTTSGRLGYLIMGREKLRWQELYDEPDTPEAERWDAYIDSHLLGGLAKRDAMTFLVDKAAVALEQSGPEGRIPAAMIRQHAEAILGAACERGGQSYYPYSLDLAVDLVLRAGERFTPAMLGSPGQELKHCFLKYLREHNAVELRTLQTLALCLYFDEGIFTYLLKEQLIVGYRASDFRQIVNAERSYVVALPDRDGFFQFNRHMQEALVSDQMAKLEDSCSAKKTVEKLLGWFGDRAKFSKPSDFSEAHGRAYLQGIDILLQAGQAQSLKCEHLFQGEEIYSWFCQFERPFDNNTFTASRVPLSRRLSDLLEKLLGLDHPKTLTLVNNLATLLCARGDLDAAEPLYRRALEGGERILGPDHPDTFLSVNNLAALLKGRGDLGAAEPLFRRALEGRERILGPDHPDTLLSVSNLAVFLANRGGFAAAEPLQRRTLEGRERILGPDHPDTLRSASNLAALLEARGDIAHPRENSDSPPA